MDKKPKGLGTILDDIFGMISKIRQLGKLQETLSGLLPLIILAVQEITLRQIASQRGDVTDNDILEVGNQAHTLQQTPLAYDLAMVSGIIGYLLATGNQTALEDLNARIVAIANDVAKNN